MDSIDKINRLLAMRGLTGAEMSRDLNLSNSAYSQWNTKKSKPSAASLKKIADYFGVTVDSLFPDEKRPAKAGQRDELIRLFEAASPELQAAALAVLRSAEASPSTPGDDPAK